MKLTLVAAALLVAVSLAVAPGALAGTGSIDIRENAVSVARGQAVLVFVTVTCSLAPTEVVLEGNLSVTQDDAFGMVGLNPVCNEKPRTYPILVPTFDGRFEAGPAFASAFLLFEDTETGETSQLSDFTVVTIRGKPAPPRAPIG